MPHQPIAVLGGGNGGHCMAADLTLTGYRVNFYKHPPSDESFDVTLRTRTVELEGVGQARIHKVTTDMAEALSDAELIMVVIPSHVQELFFNTMLPHLRNGQIVTVFTGNFGSLRLKKLLNEKIPERKITIGETSTLPYGARLTGPGKVGLFYEYGRYNKPRGPFTHLFSALPAKDTGAVLGKLQELFPALSPVKNVLGAASSNPNLPMHPMGLLLNAGRIEYSEGNFYMIKEGITPAVFRAQSALYDEIVAVGEAFNVRAAAFPESLEDTMNRLGGPDGIATGVRGPTTVKHRYFTEDVPYGLLPISELGRKGNVPTPLADALTAIASVICEEDYRSTGRTVESLGLADLSKEEIISLVEG